MYLHSLVRYKGPFLRSLFIYSHKKWWQMPIFCYLDTQTFNLIFICSTCITKIHRKYQKIDSWVILNDTQRYKTCEKPENFVLHSNNTDKFDNEGNQSILCCEKKKVQRKVFRSFQCSFILQLKLNNKIENIAKNVKVIYELGWIMCLYNSTHLPCVCIPLHLQTYIDGKFFCSRNRVEETEEKKNWNISHYVSSTSHSVLSGYCTFGKNELL